MPNIADARQTYPVTLAFVASRDELPVVLNARNLTGCGVEVGVKQGEFSEHILRNWRGCHLISVDPWAEDAPAAYLDIANVPQQVHEGCYRETQRRLAPFGERSTIWRETSAQASERIPRHSLDFVYLDARHDFASVLEDLEAWYDRVRPGGIIAGHDYLDGTFAAGVFGVKSAVDGFFAARGLAVHATIVDEPCLSWMVEVPHPDVRPALHADEPAAAAPAPLPEPLSVAPPVPGKREARLQFASSSGAHSLRLELDPAQMSQGIMLDSFDAGQMYEPETSQFLATVLRPGDTFVDVGAHVGYFSVLAGALVGPTGRVVSFEPEERNYRQLVGHLELNRLDHAVAVNAAVGQSDGKAEFHVNADNDGGHALWDVGLHGFNERSRRAPETRQIDLVSLDRFLAEAGVPAPRVMKIDAEGAEHAVVLGARSLLERSPVAFVIAEINHFGLERMGSSEAALRRTMTELGYETYAFDPAGNRIVRLGEHDVIHSEYVFNLVFRHPAAA